MNRALQPRIALRWVEEADIFLIRKKTQHKGGLLWSEGITKVQNFFLKSKRFKLHDLNP